MIQNIVLDMGNVLMEYNPQVPLDLFCQSEEEKSVIRRELFDGPEWIQGDLGYMTNEERFELVSLRMPKDMHGPLRKCVFEWDICMKPLREAQAFCRYAKEKGYRLYVLSNASDQFYQYFPRFAPLNYFDGIVVSADVHIIKPNLGIYRHLLSAYGLRPEECLFIDDMPANVEGAKKAGMEGAVFTGNFDEIVAKYRL